MSQVNNVSTKDETCTENDQQQKSISNGGGGQPNLAFVDIDDEEEEDKKKVKKEPEEEEKTLWESILNRTGLRRIIPYTSLIMILLFHVYLSFALHHHLSHDLPLLWCDGLGFVIILVVLAHLCRALSFLHRTCLRSLIITNSVRSIRTLFSTLILKRKYGSLSLHVLSVSVVLVLLLVDTAGDARRLTSLAGIVVLLLLGLVFSKHPRRINWSQVSWGMALQFLLALFVLRLDMGRSVLECMGRKVEIFLSFTDDGSSILYGYLVGRTPFLPGLLERDSVARNVTEEVNSSRAVPVVMAFKVFPVVYFFSFVVNVLFHFGIIQFVTRWMGRLLRVTVGTTACESVNAAANIFLGNAMAPLVIRPYLSRLTLSEIHCVMCAGFASIAGLIMAAYISFGVSAGHLLTACFLSAPASLAFAKLIYPETEESQFKDDDDDIDLKEDDDKGERKNLLSSACQGATDGAILVLNVMAMIVAFIASISFLNSLVSFFAGLVGFPFVTFEWILGKLCIPMAFLMGVDWAECEMVGRLLGIKIVVTEFLAYQELGQLIKEGLISSRSASITTYALCGFTCPAAAGISIAAMSALCPERRRDFSKVVGRAFVAGLASCFVTACVAGAFMREEGVEAIRDR